MENSEPLLGLVLWELIPNCLLEELISELVGLDPEELLNPMDLDKLPDELL